MENLEFDDEGSRLVEEFNASAGATARRARIIEALALKPGDRVLDVGFGPGNQAFDMSPLVGATGRIDGVDPAESAVKISERRRAHGPDHEGFWRSPGGSASAPVVGSQLADAGFKNVRAEAIVQSETDYDASSVSAILTKFVVGYVVSQGVSHGEVNAWPDDLRALGSSGHYFFSSNEYIFTANKP